MANMSKMGVGMLLVEGCWHERTEDEMSDKQTRSEVDTSFLFLLALCLVSVVGRKQNLWEDWTGLPMIIYFVFHVFPLPVLGILGGGNYVVLISFCTAIRSISRLLQIEALIDIFELAHTSGKAVPSRYWSQNQKLSSSVGRLPLKKVVEHPKYVHDRVYDGMPLPPPWCVHFQRPRLRWSGSIETVRQKCGFCCTGTASKRLLKRWFR